MSIHLYDEALAKKINNWLPKSGGRSIKVLKPDESERLFSLEADETNDKKLSLPLIALSRNTTIEMTQPTMVPMSFDGRTIKATEDKSLQLNAIPISLEYQLDIYTKRLDEANELLREILFRLINNPQLIIELNYNGESIKQVAICHLHNTIEDTSAIQQRIFSGQFSRYTLSLDIEGAYLYDLPYVDNIVMNLGDVEVLSKL